MRNKSEILRLFFSYVNEENDDNETIVKALTSVSNLIRGKTRHLQKQELISYFFNGSRPNKEYYELTEFWDRIREYRLKLTITERKQFEDIRELIYEIGGNYYKNVYKNLEANKETDFLERLDQLCKKIENIDNSKKIKFISDNLYIMSETSLDSFKKDLNNFEYDFIRYKLAVAMCMGEIVIVTAEAEDSIEDQIYAFKLEEGNWKKYSVGKIKKERRRFLEDNSRAMEKGKIRGAEW